MPIILPTFKLGHTGRINPDLMTNHTFSLVSIFNAWQKNYQASAMRSSLLNFDLNFLFAPSQPPGRIGKNLFYRIRIGIDLKPSL